MKSESKQIFQIWSVCYFWAPQSRNKKKHAESNWTNENKEWETTQVRKNVNFTTVYWFLTVFKNRLWKSSHKSPIFPIISAKKLQVANIPHNFCRNPKLCMKPFLVHNCNWCHMNLRFCFISSSQYNMVAIEF